MIKNKISDTKRDSLVKGAFSLTLSVIIVKIIGFLYKVPLSHIMGDEGMGYFNSAYTVFTFFYMLCSGGVPRAISIIVTELDTQGKNLDVHRVFLISLRMFLSIGFFFTLILMLFSRFFASLIGSTLSAFSLFMIAPSLTFVAAAGVIRGYLNGKGRMIPIALAEVIEGSVKFVFGLVFALVASLHGFEYYMISGFTVLGVTFGSFIGSSFLYIYSKKENSKEKTQQYTDCSITNKEILKRIIKISVPITLSSAIMGISNIIDLGMIIKRLISTGISEVEAVSLYGNYTTLAIPMLNLISALTSPLSASSLPHLTATCTLDKNDKFLKLTNNIFEFISLIAVPISFAYMFFSQEILILLFKDESALSASPLLSLIAPAVVFLPLLTMLNTILESAGIPKFSLISMFVGAVVKLICGYIFIGNIGISGAPLSTSISYFVSFIISFAFAALFCKIGISPIKHIFPSILFSFASIGIAKVLYNRFSVGNNTILFLICSAFSIVLYICFIAVFMRNRLNVAVSFVKINKKQ